MIGKNGSVLRKIKYFITGQHQEVKMMIMRAESDDSGSETPENHTHRQESVRTCAHILIAQTCRNITGTHLGQFSQGYSSTEGLHDFQGNRVWLDDRGISRI